MQTMFLKFCGLTLLLMLSACATAAEEQQPGIRISNRPEDAAKSVYVGRDEEMPIGAGFELAIQPTRDADGKLVVPTTLPSALREMRQMLPHWYLNALAVSKGDYECSVIVNDIGYSTLVISWIWVYWNLDSEQSPLRKELASLGVPLGSERMIMFSAIESGFCEFVKTNDENTAMKEMARYGRLK